MKKILSYLSMAVVALFFPACSDYLNIEPLDKVPATQLFSDISGVKVLLANLYNQMPVEDFTYEPNSGFNYHGSGGAYSASSTSIFTDESISTVGSGVGPVSDGYWSYSAIRQVNQFMDALPTVKMDDAQRNRLMSEAHFIRAYMYFGLVKRYGGVPIIDKVLEYDAGTDNATLFVPRSTEKQTWDFVLKECDLAIQNLPASVTSTEGTYRATKWAALALKSRAALFAASIAKYWNRAPLTGDAVTQNLVGGMTGSDADNYYQQCIDASKTIIDNSGKALYKPIPANRAEASKNYQDIFQNPSIADVEVIFKKGYIDGTASKLQGHSTDSYFNPAQTNPGSLYFGRWSVALNLVDLYEDYSDNGIGKSASLVTRTDGNESDVIADPTKFDITKPFKQYDNLSDIFANKDARLFGSIIVPGSVWKGVTIIMQGGLIKQDGTKVIYADASAPGKDGKTYYSFGASSNSAYSAFYNLGQGNNNWSCTGFSLKKFLQEGKNVLGVNFSSTTDYIDFRLAEIYLNYDEATIESGKGDASQAATYLNALRKRAGHTDNIPSTLENILKERRIEMAFEGSRYWDLVRRREYHTLFSFTRRTSLVPVIDLRQPTPKYIFVRANNFYDERSNGQSFQTKSYYKAIPGTSTNNLVQNPQY